MITVRDLMVRINNDDDLEKGLSRLTKDGRIVAIIPQPKNLQSALTYKVVIEQESTVTRQTTDSDLAYRLEKLSEAAETGPWFASKLEEGEMEDDGVISIGGYDLGDSVANHHYENTILEIWNNGNIAGDVESTAALLCELVNNLPVIIKALRNDSSELTVQSFT